MSGPIIMCTLTCTSNKVLQNLSIERYNKIRLICFTEKCQAEAGTKITCHIGSITFEMSILNHLIWVYNFCTDLSFDCN